MKKLVILSLLTISTALFADYRCETVDVCSPFVSPFIINVDKGFIEFPELVGDRAISNHQQIAEVEVFSFEGGEVEVVQDVDFNTPFGGVLKIDGDEFNVACKLIF